MRIPIKGQIDKDLDSVTVTQWYKKIGDEIKKGENVLHVETLKADVDLPAESEGILTDIVAQEGEDIIRPVKKPTGSWDAIFGWIETENIALTQPVSVSEKVKEEIKKIDPLPIELPTAVVEDRKEAVKEFIKAVPFARKRARELGIDLSSIQGSGPRGIITVRDVEASVSGKTFAEDIQSQKESAPKQFKEHEEPFTIVNLGFIARAIAENMESSKCIPHAGVSVRVNFWNIIKARKAVESALSTKVGINALRYMRFEIIVIQGILRVLSQKFGSSYHDLNSCFGCQHFGFEGLKIFEHINLGVACDHPAGLLVPVLPKMEGASYKTTAERLDDLYKRLQKNKLKSSEFKGGTFTFNNVGAIGADDGESIIVHGQSCICSFHRIDMDEDSPFYGYTNLGLRFDHRAHTRGAAVTGFLNEVKKFIEEVDFERHVLSEF